MNENYEELLEDWRDLNEVCNSIVRHLSDACAEKEITSVEFRVIEKALKKVGDALEELNDVMLLVSTGGNEV